MELFSVADKHIAVTGASSGFGHHFAGVLAGRGAKVSLGARRQDKLQARVSDLKAQGGAAMGAALDVRDPNSMQSFLTAAEAAFGPIDVLINNAGVESGPKTYMMIDEDDWDAVIDTNLKSAWLMSKLYTERVIAYQSSGAQSSGAQSSGAQSSQSSGKTSGNIINISSITDTRTIKGQFPYAVSKGGLTRMTEVLALEAPRYGIRVNALAPGYILTDVSRVLLESERSPEFMQGIPLRRYGEFEDLDGPLLLLASDASRYMNGSVVVVDGGHICASL
jgi:NAD(P)-dependent dehydrogenase (short-subunit alcohol dehydrogenase family)